MHIFEIRAAAERMFYCDSRTAALIYPDGYSPSLIEESEHVGVSDRHTRRLDHMRRSLFNLRNMSFGGKFFSRRLCSDSYRGFFSFSKRHYTNCLLCGIDEATAWKAVWAAAPTIWRACGLNLVSAGDLLRIYIALRDDMTLDEALAYVRMLRAWLRNSLPGQVTQS